MVAAIERVVGLVGRATSWLALVIVLLMATNVVLRYLFSYGTVWSQELEWHLLTPLIMLGIAYAWLDGSHVRVDVAHSHFGPRAQAAVDMLSALIAMGLSVLVIWFGWKYVMQAYSIDEGSPDPGGLPHRWILKAFIPLGFALLLLQSFAELAKSLARFREAGR